MSDWTASSRVKIERAKEHIQQLEAAVGAFFESNPYEAVGEPDVERGMVLYRARIRAEPPPRIGAIVGDAVHNLRSALDVLICQLYETATGKTAPRSLDFPIYDSRKEFESKRLLEIKRASQDAVDLIKALKPYKGGNDALWILQSLNNRDKHHVLTAVASGLSHISMSLVQALLRHIFSSATVTPEVRDAALKFLSESKAKPMNFLVAPKERFCPLKDGTVIHWLPLSLAAHAHHYTQVTFEVAFAEGELVHAQPIVPTIQQLADMVEGIVEAFANLPIRPPHRSPPKS